MSWNEDNFLERLIPDVAQEKQSCPDGTTICAVAEGEASSWLSQQCLKHAAQCRECAELLRRLNRLQNATVPAGNFEWAQTEKRLENWMIGVLEANSDAREVPKGQIPSSSRRSTWRSVLRMPVAAVGLAVLAVSFTALFWLISRPGAPSQSQQTVSTSSQPPATQPSKPVEQQLPTIVTAKNNTEVGLKKPSLMSRRRESSQKPKGESVAAASNSQIQHEAGSGTSTVASSALSPTITSSEKDQPKPETIASAVPIEGGASPQPSGTNPPVEGPTILTEQRPAISAGTSAHSSATRSRSFVPLTVMSASERALVRPSPPTVTLAAGTRVWVTLSSVKQDEHGDFTFAGSLLLPIKQGNLTLLDRGVIVRGSGSNHQGHATVLIHEFLNNGVLYRIKDTTQSGKANLFEPGPVVHFNEGKVLEMWLSGDLLFSRVGEDATKK